LLLEGLDLGDYVAPFRAAGVNGNTLHFSETRDELKEDKGVDISSVGFRVLRAAVEEYAPSGVPTALLEEARGRVQQREQEAAAEEARRRAEREAAEEARCRAEAQAAEEARRRAEAQAAEEARRRAEREVAQQREREANLLRLNAQAPRKVRVL
jgi:hypothetical protein